MNETVHTFDFNPNYDELFYKKTEFELIDAGKVEEPYTIKVDLENFSPDAEKEHISHIYSYNKVMTIESLEGIAKCLNMTDFKILAWYLNPAKTYSVGVRHVKLLFKKSMRSTGG